MKPTRTVLLSLGALLLAAPPASARPAHKRAFADHLGAFLPKKLNDCRTCHLPGDAKDEKEKPHNPFGARLAAVRSELRKAGKATEIAARIQAVADEDSDGDGVANLIELLAGTNPGERDDRPDAAGVGRARGALPEFLKSLEGYRWRPFETVQRPPVPPVKSAAWLRNPIDAFVAAEHERLGLKPRPEAPRHVLLRRVHLDLIGLPPTREELHAFLTDESPDAYERVVERLLNSPQHGERWGRHWMDVWRYSDWAGYGAQVRDSQPHVWRWRDWIIESVNADKGYDRMILEMLADDELDPENPQTLRATGYLVRNFKLLSRETWMQDTVEHTFLAFQAVTIGCAKCHDHMFDPILQSDYYRIRAIFEPHHVRTDRVPGQPDVAKDGVVRAYDKDLDAPTLFYVRGDDRTPDKNRKILPGVPESLGGNFAIAGPVSLPMAASNPDKRAFVIRETEAAASAAVTMARAALDAARAKGGAPITLAELDLAQAEASAVATEAVLRAERLEDAGQRGTKEWSQAALTATESQRRAALLDARRKLAAIQRTHAALTEKQPPGKPPDPKRAAADKALDKFLAAATKALAKAEADAVLPPTTAYTPRATKVYPKTSTGRRLALAKWIADKDNPLTARVAVNHIWLRHFGQALVPTVFDFGRNGRPPSHPALLDWLAAEFMDRDWSMRALHRLIVTSAAYRTDSTPDPASLALDRDNKYLWRMAPRRAEAEAVRDGIFHVAGRLDRAFSGPDIDYPLGLTVPRRSLYFRHAAEKQMEFLQLFDAASVSECYERKHSVIPQQALALFNSELARRHGRLLARDLAAKAGPDVAAFVTAAFEQVLTRRPTPAELSECLAYLRERTEEYRRLKQPAAGDNDGRAPSPDPALRARESLIHVLLNHHEFVTVR